MHDPNPVLDRSRRLPKRVHRGARLKARGNVPTHFQSRAIIPATNREPPERRGFYARPRLQHFRLTTGNADVHHLTR
jgi:hypothetical protein